MSDLEQEDWPLVGFTFDLKFVSNYLYRPNLRHIFDLVGPDGFLIYETFGVGNELFGRPSNPDFLLRPSGLGPAGAEFIMDEFFGELVATTPTYRLFARRVIHKVSGLFQSICRLPRCRIASV